MDEYQNCSVSLCGLKHHLKKNWAGNNNQLKCLKSSVADGGKTAIRKNDRHLKNVLRGLAQKKMAFNWQKRRLKKIAFGKGKLF